jgi:hypothetical protein
MERTRPPNAIFYNRILKTSWYASESAQNKNTSSIEKPPTRNYLATAQPPSTFVVMLVLVVLLS